MNSVRSIVKSKMSEYGLESDDVIEICKSIDEHMDYMIEAVDCKIVEGCLVEIMVGTYYAEIDLESEDCEWISDIFDKSFCIDIYTVDNNEGGKMVVFNIKVGVQFE